MLVTRIFHSFTLHLYLMPFVALFAYAQNTEYPLEIGTRWAWAFNFDTHPSVFQEILGDTIMPNGHDYAIFYPDFFPGMNSRFERKVSNRVYRYFAYADTEYLWFDFSAQAGDTINHNPNIILQSVSTDTLFGKSRRKYWFLYDPVPDAIDDEIYFQVTDSIGVTGIDWYDGLWLVRGARIGGQILGTLTHVTDGISSLPNEFTVEPIYPNPFNNSARITFSLQRQMDVTISIYDQLGRSVQLILDQSMSPGIHSFNFPSGNLSSGVYFCRVNADGMLKQEKMIILK